MTVYRGGEIPAGVAAAFINAYFSHTPVGTEENNDVPGFQAQVEIRTGNTSNTVNHYSSCVDLRTSCFSVTVTTEV
jgi:hypothetical protein